jgi:hypothetical protein
MEVLLGKVFSLFVRAEGVIRRTTGARKGNWKRDAIQRRSEYGSRGITIVGPVARQLLVKTLHAVKILTCDL